MPEFAPSEEESEEDDIPAKPAIRPDEDLNTPTQASPPAKEILGADLLTMVSENGVEFSENHLTVLFSKESIWDLGVKNEDVLSVLIKDEGEHSFSIAVTRNGEFVETFKDLQIQIPYKTDAECPLLILLDEEGNTAAEGTYDPQAELASFTVVHTGRYTIAEQTCEKPAPVVPSVPTAPPSGPSAPSAPSAPSHSTVGNANMYLLPVALLAVVSLLSLAAGTMFLRRREEAV